MAKAKVKEETPAPVNLQELENIVAGLACIEEVLKVGSFPGSICEKTIAAIKFAEALKNNQINVLNQFKTQSSDKEEKVLNLE